MLSNFLHKLYDGCGVGAALSILLMCIFVVTGIVSRMLQVTVPGGIEISSFCLVSASFLALAQTFRHNVHIRISVLTQYLSPKGRRYVELFSLLVAGLISAWATLYAGTMAWESFIFNDRSEGMLPIPLWIPQLLMAVGILMLSISIVEEFVRMCRGHEPVYNILGSNADSDDFGADR